MSSWEMKPAPGSRPAATSSTTATADAAVVQEIARQTRPLIAQRLVGAHVLLAGQLAGRGVAVAAGQSLHGRVQVHHVIVHRRLGVDQDLPGQLAPVAQAQLVEEEPHQLEVTGVAHGLVVQALDPALEGLAHRAQAARGQRRLQLDAADDHAFGSVIAGTIWRTPPRSTSQSLRYSLTTPSADQLKA